MEEQHPKENGPLLSVNLNTILTSCFGVAICALVALAWRTTSDNNRELDKVNNSLPYLEKSIGKMELSLSQMITRSEFDSKQSRTDAQIEKISTEQDRVRLELVRKGIQVTP